MCNKHFIYVIQTIKLVFCVSEYIIHKIVSTIYIVDFLFVAFSNIQWGGSGRAITDTNYVLAYLIISKEGSYNRLRCGDCFVLAGSK